MGVALSRVLGGLKMYRKFYKIYLDLDHELSDAIFFKYPILIVA